MSTFFNSEFLQYNDRIYRSQMFMVQSVNPGRVRFRTKNLVIYPVSPWSDVSFGTLTKNKKKRKKDFDNWLNENNKYLGS